MIIEYHRPNTLDEALQLLQRSNPLTLPMGGGTVLNQPNREAVAVVDLQMLGLEQVEENGNLLRVGAMVRLQTLLETGDQIKGFAEIIRHEAPVNIRQAATIAGAVAAGDGRSPLLAGLLACDAKLELQHAGQAMKQIKIADWLLQHELRQGALITTVLLPLNVHLAYQYVARTPADQPILGAVVAKWPAGRTRLVLCGWGAMPVLAMDGPEASGIEAAARNAASEASDAWASQDYRQAMAGVLARRAVGILETDPHTTVSEVRKQKHTRKVEEEL